MATNKPTVIAWAPSLVLARLSLNGGLRNGVGCILTDGPTPHGNDAAMVRLSEYNALQAECDHLRAAIRHLCNIYAIDDYYMGKQREEMLDAAVVRAIDAATQEPSHDN